jgi:histidinol-phosphate/aromatic aminotransferase/cobyric acid decarboxylase-like protein
MNVNPLEFCETPVLLIASSIFYTTKFFLMTISDACFSSPEKDLTLHPAVKLGVGQAPHGGQEWRHISNFVNDFSVTTNSRGPPEPALEAARKELENIEHYPAQDFEPAVTDLAGFLAGGDAKSACDIRARLILGNGASELIDMVARLAPEGSWKPGNTRVQYMEYERSAHNYCRKKIQWNDKSARLTCMVNPTNPTGDYLPINEMKAFIESNCGDGSFVVVDESMQPWIGPEWHRDSLVSQGEWVKRLYETRGISVYVIHSWTKLWSCPGIRLGSILTPTEEFATEMRRIQVPWSVNGPALAFLSAAIQDYEYLNSTWETTSKFRADLEKGINAMHPSWTIHGKSWSSWLWVDCHDSTQAKAAVDACKAAGVPIRWGKYGYECPTFIRIGVRDSKYHEPLFDALKTVA